MSAKSCRGRPLAPSMSSRTLALVGRAVALLALGAPALIILLLCQSFPTSNAGENATPSPTLESYHGVYQWGPWGEMSACTRTCAIGVRYRKRYCYYSGDVVRFINNNSLCGQLDREYISCNTQPCHTLVDDFRARQCAVHDRSQYRGKYFRWKPYRYLAGTSSGSILNPCSLICKAVGGHFSFAVKFSDDVIDGTPCTTQADGKRGVCVNRKCVTVGCDGQLNSPINEDLCGVCGGHNATCRQVSGKFTKQISLGYNHILTIPREARRISVQESQSTTATFALQNTRGVTLIDGHHTLAYPSEHDIGGTTVYTEHHEDAITGGISANLHARGPTRHILNVMLLSPVNKDTVTITYEYTLPQEHQSTAYDSEEKVKVENSRYHRLSIQAPPKLTLKKAPVTARPPVFIPEVEVNENLIKYEKKKVQFPVHHRDIPSTESPENETTESMSDTTLESDNITESPVANSSGENDQGYLPGYPGIPAPAILSERYPNAKKLSTDFRYYWKTDKVAPCSVTCSTGIQSAYAQCYRNDDVMVEDRFCDESERPQSNLAHCTGKPCNPRWVASMWSACSVSCGSGVQYRSVHCWRMMAPGFDSTVHDYVCADLEKPSLSRKCHEVECGPQWQISQWGKCSRECGHGVQNRNVRCSSRTSPCDPNIRPRTARHCNNGPCVHEWVVSEWSQCTGGCGDGLMRRSLTCRGKEGSFLHDKFCDQSRRPLSFKACSSEASQCRPLWVPQDWGVCSVTCGQGITTRRVVCGQIQEGDFIQKSDETCKGINPKPSTRARCREPPCKAEWFTTEWSQCSKSCGDGGFRVRKVQCYRNNKISTRCDTQTRLADRELCSLSPCERTSGQGLECVDEIEINCVLVRQVHLCQHWYYKKACCLSCKDHQTTNITIAATVTTGSQP